MKELINDTLIFYCESVQQLFINSSQYAAIKKASDSKGYSISTLIWKSPVYKKTYSYHLCCEIRDKEDKCLEIFDMGESSMFQQLVAVDKHNRVKFFPLDHDDFLSDVQSWALALMTRHSSVDE